MPYYNVSAINGSGLDTLLVGVSSVYPGMMQLLLFFEFLFITLTGTYAQKRNIGITNLIQWATIGAMVTTTSAFILYLIPNLLDLYTVITCMGITICLALAFFFSGKDDE